MSPFPNPPPSFGGLSRPRPPQVKTRHPLRAPLGPAPTGVVGYAVREWETGGGLAVFQRRVRSISHSQPLPLCSHPVDTDHRSLAPEGLQDPSMLRQKTPPRRGCIAQGEAGGCHEGRYLTVSYDRWPAPCVLYDPDHIIPHPLCDIPSGCCSFTGALDSHPFSPSHVASGRCVLSAAAAGALAGVVSAFAEPRRWCAGAVLVAAGCAVCATVAPSSWRIGGCAGCCPPPPPPAAFISVPEVPAPAHHRGTDHLDTPKPPRATANPGKGLPPGRCASGEGGGRVLPKGGGGGPGTQKSKSWCTKNSPNQYFRV